MEVDMERYYKSEQVGEMYANFEARATRQSRGLRFCENEDFHVLPISYLSIRAEPF